MRRYGPYTKIGSFKINEVSKGASINFGPSIHKGLQANSKFQAAEYIIGDEIVFDFCKGNGEENEEENENNEENEACPKFEMNKFVINKCEKDNEDENNDEEDDDEQDNEKEEDKKKKYKMKKPKEKCKVEWKEFETDIDHHLDKLKIIYNQKKKR
ncbi:MAG: spore germination protein [Bacillaceae bacterium]|nr:spore germination protein [Bacillaceae bacterium]